jgi:hypothetical protein
VLLIHFFMNVILICLCRSQIFEFCHIFKGYISNHYIMLSRESSVGIGMGYGLDDRGSGVRLPAGLGIFLFTTQPPIQWVLGALSLWVKRPGREADHSPPSGAEVKE